ncbi:SEPN1 (predicted) [Pycnogonum litorale]
MLTGSCLISFVSFIISALIALYISQYYYQISNDQEDEAVYYNSYKLFNQLDKNHDSFLSQSEFFSGIKVLKNVDWKFNGDSSRHNRNIKDLRPSSDEELSIKLKCSYETINVTDSLSRWLKYSNNHHLVKVLNGSGDDGGATLILNFFHSFETYCVVSMRYLIKVFKPLNNSVGTVFWIIPPDDDDVAKFISETDVKSSLLHSLLTIFHPRPFVNTRSQPQGCVAIVRAVSPDYTDIYFRMHAEFLLSEASSPTFWFTPAQFHGHLVFDRHDNRVIYFSLEVPNKRSVNVEMEWGDFDGNTNNVDVSYIPKMKLESNDPKSFEEAESIQWSSEISEQDASLKLLKEMYPYAEVDYHNLNDALSLAKQQNKLIHLGVLWGALDDQSC